MRWIACVFFFLTAAPAMACGVDSDCQLGDRVYRIHMPPAKAGAHVGAILFAHGYRGTAAGTMGDKTLIALADELGVALVAPQAGKNDWELPGRPRHKENTGEVEFSYFRRLVDELVTRYGIDRHKLLVAGFSAGGMLVWNLACHEGELFAGFAPMSGTFWSPVPKSCPSKPVDLMHFHGTEDPIVPIIGRAIADTRQMDVGESFELFKRQGDFGEAKPVPAADGLTCERSTNPQGKILEYCTHRGGHFYKAAFVRRAWEAMHIADR